jgi:protease-4
VKAVVLAIDSPGGSVIASDRIWHAVRRLAGRKPVVASIGPMGASGGYYIASGATEVFALEQSLVGSIGVVSGKANASALLGRLGVNPVTVARRAHAGAATLTRAFTAEERAHVQASMQQHYDRFIRRIVAGRGLPEARVREVAEGRLWTGRAAHAHGLVQTLGGFEAALARARTLGNLPADASTSHWPSDEGFLERLVALFVGEGANTSAIARFMERANAYIPFLDAFLSVLETSPVLAALPYVLEIR